MPATFRVMPRYSLVELTVGQSSGAEKGVTITNLNEHAHLSPDQARKVATALLEHAAAAERTGEDEWP